MNLRATTLQNTAIVIILASVIGTGLSIFVFAINNDVCQFLLPTLCGQEPPETICLKDSTCKSSEDPKSAVYRNFTDIGNEKVRFLEKLVKNPDIQSALKHSNERDGKMSEDIRIQIYIQREKEWITSEELTPLMKSVIYNKVSDFLRDNLEYPSDNFGNFIYGEHILTNIYGGNVAITVRSDNYDQSRDEWWQYMFLDQKGNPFARSCEFDKSADMNSEDLVIKIHDNETGEFIGILNSATPCNVILRPDGSS